MDDRIDKAKLREFIAEQRARFNLGPTSVQWKAGFDEALRCLEKILTTK